jgi:hypothetical protein
MHDALYAWLHVDSAQKDRPHHVTLLCSLATLVVLIVRERHQYSAPLLASPSGRDDEHQCLLPLLRVLSLACCAAMRAPWNPATLGVAAGGPNPYASMGPFADILPGAVWWCATCWARTTPDPPLLCRVPLYPFAMGGSMPPPPFAASIVGRVGMEADRACGESPFMSGAMGEEWKVAPSGCMAVCSSSDKDEEQRSGHRRTLDSKQTMTPAAYSIQLVTHDRR